ncbi:MAG: CoA transferase, partial [Chloroflexota bacterium]|nr:CoA transferase [Chloroflexota bacterium]
MADTQHSVLSTQSFPLEGLRVLAMEAAVAGPLATRHLADLGADVIKVERPEGDFARRYDETVQGLSAYFVWLNRGKRSIVLDWRQPRDRDALDRLLARSDALVHNLGPGAMERLGLGKAQLTEQYPQLIHCGISGYGTDGPYATKKAFDLLVQGESGVISVTGTPEQPCKVGISIGDISAGMYA